MDRPSDQGISGTDALDNRSRAPRQRRARQRWDEGVLEQLVALRGQMPSPGLEKLQLFLADWCEPRGLHCPSVSTLRRVAKADKRLMPVRHQPPPSTRLLTQAQRRPKGYAPRAPGECVGVDTIEIHGSGIYSGMRRYVVSFKDMHSRFALGAALPSKHARHSARLWHIARACYPFKPQRVLIDNGSEFKAEFAQIVLDDGALAVLASATTKPICGFGREYSGAHIAVLSSLVNQPGLRRADALHCARLSTLAGAKKCITRSI